VHIGGSASRDSYLQADRIIAACKKTGAEAVHPGYGFLSENEAFARKVEEEGIVFIGPKHHSIAAMGDKIASKKLANEAKVSTIPGHNEPILSPEEAVEIAKKIGYPVMIKASAGGGGKGLRVAFNDKECFEGFTSCRNEARNSFGDDRVFMEKFVEQPRHIEIQVLGDSQGNVVYLHERECSIQRRHQKVIEEAPSPFISEATRKAMGEQAVALAKAVKYQSAGTVEFVVGKDQDFYFLEMNTRLQVEHPVTEVTTGLDLVREQFRIAEGKELHIKQDPTPRGHAFEFRINGEDAGSNFMPAPGAITKYVEPSGPGVRMDSGVREGSVVGGQFDSMLAKLIVFGETREEALQRSRRALSEYVIEGMPTVVPFHRHIVENPAFVGDDTHFDVYTKWIEEEWENPIPPYVDPADAEEAEEATPNQKVVVEIDGRRVEIALPGDLALAGGGAGGAKKKAKKRRSGGSKAGVSGDAVAAPMQGTVIKVNVEEGQEVAEGEVVVVLEAMKMENPVKAHKSGVVTDLAVSAGEGVTKGSVMMELK